MEMSRNEGLLKAILDGIVLSDFEPQSRAEQYLLACVNKTGTAGLPTPQCRNEILLYELADVLAEGTPSVKSNIAKLVDKSMTVITAADLAGATQIGSYAFYDLKSLTSIQIPSSVTKIGNRAFAYCTSLASIVIPSSVTTIDNYAFRYDDALVNVRIEATNITIGADAFNIGSATNKATITMLATTPPTIQANSFNASTLEKIVVPAGCGDAYKAAANWSNYASYIVEATA